MPSLTLETLRGMAAKQSITVEAGGTLDDVPCPPMDDSCALFLIRFRDYIDLCFDEELENNDEDFTNVQQMFELIVRVANELGADGLVVRALAASRLTRDELADTVCSVTLPSKVGLCPVMIGALACIGEKWGDAVDRWIASLV